MKSGFICPESIQYAIPQLDCLVKPKSVAIIGCSQNESSLSGRPLKYLLEKGYKGNIYPVNPKYDKIRDIICYPSITAVSEPVDVALIMIPAAAVEQAVKDCIQAKVGAAIIISSGFAELGSQGREMQDRIAQLSKEASMPILGPNCLGMINVLDQIPLTFSSTVENTCHNRGSLALVSQSGAVGSFILAVAQEADIGFTYWVTTGNEATLDATAVARYLLCQEEVKGVLMYLEEARDAKGLIQAGHVAQAVDKPLICLKVGRYGSGKRAAMSHTGAMAGSDAEYDAAFRHAGIVRAEHIEDMLDLGIVFANPQKLRGNRVAIVTVSGGAGILAADRCEEIGLKVPELSDSLKTKLADVVPSFGSVINPVDVTGELVGSPGLLRGTLEVVAETDEVDSILVLLGVQKKAGPGLARDIAAVAKGTSKPVVVGWMAPPAEAVEILRDAEVPMLFDIVKAVNALGKLTEFTVEQGPIAKAVAKEPQESLVQKVPALSALMEFVKEDTVAAADKSRISLSEAKSKQLLSQVGLSVPKSKVVCSAEEAIRLATSIGYPVVAKISSPDILHKSDARAVRIGLTSPESVADAFHEIMANAKEYNPQAKIEGVLLEEMIVGDSLETIVGLKWSEKFGPMIMFGIGGVLVEVLKDVSLRLAPVDEQGALNMIEELRTAKLFHGFRGRKPRDIEALAKSISLLSYVGAGLGEQLLELDINPLFVLEEGKGVRIGDALIVLKKM